MRTRFSLDALAQPFSPAIDTLRHYSLRKLHKDIIAGMTVSVVEVPQSMAYAVVAGVPPVYGLYTSIIQGVIGAMLSSSEHMTTGPTNTQSLLIASTVKAIVAPGANAALYLQLVFGLTLIKGLLQLLFAAARMGNLVRYISHSVIVGLVAGAGVLILVGQFPHFLGISDQGVGHLPGFLDFGVLGRLDRLFFHLPEINGFAIAVGTGVLAVNIGLRSISKMLPGALIGVTLSAIAVAALHWGPDQLPLIDSLPKSLPHPINPWPGFLYARELMTGALALAVLGMLESVAIAKSIAAYTGERISANQEFFAQGLKNTITSFFQCIPGSGSFTRSALDYAAGAETRFAAVFNALFVALIFFLFADYARYIPMASLAGVLFAIAVGLIDWRYFIRTVRTSRSDALVCFATFAATLLAPLEYAIFIGVFLSLALYLRKVSRLRIAELVQAPGGAFIERPIADHDEGRQIMFLQVEGDLFFGVASELEDQLNLIARSRARVVIFRLKRTHMIDAEVRLVLEEFIRDAHSRGKHVILCGVRTELISALRAQSLLDAVGRENVFEADTGIFSSAKAALQRASELIGASVVSNSDLDREATSYEI